VLTWLDVLALFSLAVTTAVGMRKGAVFLPAFLLGLVLYGLALDWAPPWSWPLLGLLAGLLAAQIAGRLGIFVPRHNLDMAIGGLGGFLWGALLAVGLWTGLPAQYSVASGGLRYPSPDLPVVVQDAVRESPFALRIFQYVQGQPFLKRFFLASTEDEAGLARLPR